MTMGRDKSDLPPTPERLRRRNEPTRRANSASSAAAVTKLTDASRAMVERDSTAVAAIDPYLTNVPSIPYLVKIALSVPSLVSFASEMLILLSRASPLRAAMARSKVNLGRYDVDI